MALVIGPSVAAHGAGAHELGSLLQEDGELNLVGGAGEISFRPFIRALFPRCRRRVGAVHLHAVALGALLGDSFIRLREALASSTLIAKSSTVEITLSGEHLDARLERLLQSARASRPAAGLTVCALSSRSARLSA